MKRIVRPINGILQDQPAAYLPEGALSSGVNIRVRDGSLEAVPGYASVYGTPQVAPLWVIPVVRSTTDHFWLYAGTGAVYAVDEANTHTDITNSGGAYSATADLGWNGGIFGTIPVLNNGVDVPQQWSSISTGTNLTDISNWETDVASGATCKVLRPFKQYLVALNTSESSTDYPQRVRWSDKGSAGSLPTWDASDATQDAGFNDLLDSYDGILDGLPLRDRFAIYKENETYLMSFVGGSRVFTFRRVFKTSGVLGTDCVTEYRGRHFCLTQGDCVTHDGNSVQSIIDQQNREWLFSKIDSVNYDRSFVVLNEADEEVWFCVPEDGASYATLAAVYSLQTGTWGVVELPGVRHIERGEIFQTGTDSWNSDSSSWDSDSTRWDASQYNPADTRLLFAGTDDTKLYEWDSGNTADGTAFRANATRESDPFGDTDQQIRILKVRPIMNASNGASFTIRIGTQQKLGDAIDYTDYTYTYGTDEEVSVRKTGKYISWEIESESDISWRLDGIEFEYREMGSR